MNFSTNQVKQLYVLDANSSVTQKVIKTPDGAANKAVVLDVDGERTDIIPLDNIISVTTALASAAGQQMIRKGVLVALNSNVNSGNPVAGQDYIIKLTFRGHIGEEVAYHKFAEAHAVTGMTSAQLLQKLAASFLVNQKVEATPLYELYDQATGKKIVDTIVSSSTECLATAVTATGFYIVEPVPYWALGKFPETLMNITLETPAIVASSDEVIDWLANYQFAPIASTTLAAVTPIFNSHKIADLEYFCKGEKGISAPYHKPYDDVVDPGLKVNANAANGYDILTIHYAFVGANASNQKSEKDLVIVAPGNGTSTINSKLSTIKAALEALTVGGVLADHEDRIEALEDAE